MKQRLDHHYGIPDDHPGYLKVQHKPGMQWFHHPKGCRQPSTMTLTALSAELPAGGYDGLL